MLDNGLKGSNAQALTAKLVLRFPQIFRDQIKHQSEINRRSMNSEIIVMLEKSVRFRELLVGENVVF